MRDPVADWKELSALYEHAETLGVSELKDWVAGLRVESRHLVPHLERMLGARARMAQEGLSRDPADAFRAGG